jgi:hypothetical protein
MPATGIGPAKPDNISSASEARSKTRMGKAMFVYVPPDGFKRGG